MISNIRLKIRFFDKFAFVYWLYYKFENYRRVLMLLLFP